MLTKHVEKMFPISFARKDVYGARSLSESNLVSWLQHFSPDSDTPHTFMVTESIPVGFATAGSDLYIEFILGGYYVRLSGSYFTAEIESCDAATNKETSYYAYIEFNKNDNECFTTLLGNEQGDEFTALTIVTDKTQIPKTAAYSIHLLTLKQTNIGTEDSPVKSIEYIIPRTSLRTVDGGAI